MWTVVPALALAGVHDDLRSLGDDGPDLAVACSSAHELAEVVDRLAGGGPAGIPVPAGLQRLFGRDTLGAVMTPESRLTIAVWELPAPGPLGRLVSREPSLALTFDTPLALDPLADEVGSALGYAVEARGAERVLRAPGSDENLVVAVEAGRATFRSPGERPKGHPLDARAIDRLPDADGCGIAMRLPARETGPGPTLAVHVPFGSGEPVRFALQTAEAGLLEPFEPRSYPPVTTVAVPFAVLSLGLPLERVDWDKVASSGKERRVARWVVRHLPIDQLTVALFRFDDEEVAAERGWPSQAGRPLGGTEFAAELRLARPWSAEKTARRMRRTLGRLERQGMPLHVLRIDDTRFELVGVKSLGVVAVEGGLQLASTDRLLGELTDRRGEPWLAGAAEGHAAENHLFAQLDAGQLPELAAAPGTVLSVGMRLGEDGVLEGELHVPLTLDELTAWAARMRALGPPRIGGLPGR